MTIEIRPARAAEIEAVREIERRSATRFLGTARAELAEDEPTEAGVLAERVRQGGLLVAAEAGAPVAFVMFRPVEGCAYVEQIDVLPSHARRGSARRCWMRWARSLGPAGWRR
jgi:predicted N-acetyltransferase YhbS